MYFADGRSVDAKVGARPLSPLTLDGAADTRSRMERDMSNSVSRKPKITLTESDHARLEALALTLEDRNPAVAGAMLAELDRARIVSERALPRGTVRVGSEVTFVMDEAAPRTGQLVYPGEADIASGRISVATPVGAALIGLSVGHAITWAGSDGRPRRLRLLAVDGVAARETA
jgi:regulator of nucleoside diphosphate kinase